MKRPVFPIVLALAALGGVVFFAWRGKNGAAFALPGESRFFEDLVDWTFPSVPYQSPDEWRAELLPLIRRQERALAMPPGLLEAVIERESAFRHDIITGAKEGTAGEQGIMQLKPQYHMTSSAERNNPRLAIPYGATYLAKNYLRFGTWRDAVIAYNCGPTDWERYGAARCGPALAYVAAVEARVGSLA